MKIQLLSTFVFLLIVTISSAQTTVFTKNEEIARYNESKNTSKTVKHTFTSSSEITNGIYELICTTMEAKDGMVSCKRIGNYELEVTHENWVLVHDIIDMIKIGIVVVEKPSTGSQHQSYSKE